MTRWKRSTDKRQQLGKLAAESFGGDGTFGRSTGWVPFEWYGAAAGLGRFARELESEQREACRTMGMRGKAMPLLGRVGPKVNTQGAPAAWDPKKDEILINGGLAGLGDDGDAVNFDDPTWRQRNRMAAGFVVHEVGHAAHTPKQLLDVWNKLSPQALQVCQVLEETRMERQTLEARQLAADEGRINSESSSFDAAENLRACATEMVARGWRTGHGPLVDSLNASLLLGRSELEGGAMLEADLAPIREALGQVFTPEQLRAMEQLRGEYHALGYTDVAHVDPATLEHLASRWAQAVGAPDETGGQDGGQGEAGDGDGQGGQGEAGSESADGRQGQGEAGQGGDPADGTDGPQDGAQAGQDGQQGGQPQDGGEQNGTGQGAPTQPLDDTGTGSGPDVRNPMDAVRQLLGDVREADRQRQLADNVAADLADRAADRETLRQDTAGFTGRGSDTPHPHWHSVDSDLRKLAVELTKQLRKLAVPVVDKRHVAMELPPGKLRSRGAVERCAQLAAGTPPTARQWTQTRKRTAGDPPPVIGVMLDVSGSMKAAHAPTCRVLWALSEAAGAIGAQTAGVLFGTAAVPYKHDRRRWVTTEGGNGFETFAWGFEHVNRRLHLTTKAQNPRVLVIVSDGAYGKADHARYCTAALRECQRQGVAILWVTCPGNRMRQTFGSRPKMGQHVEISPDASGARDLAAAILRAINRKGNE